MAQPDRLLHNSTASLLAKHLRGRRAPFSKVFCWLRRDDGILETSDTPGVRHVESTFPFDAYDTPNADRLAVFAAWLVRAVAIGAPELAIGGEINAFTEKLSAEQYTYTRIDKLKRKAGEPSCQVQYIHTPFDLEITANCELEGGRTLSRTLRDHSFLRDELVYGRSITRCSVSEGDQLLLETHTRPL